jgi:type VI secretion system protein ImpH
VKRDAPAMARLKAEPARFGFDAAVRVLLHAAHTADPAAAARFRSLTGFAFPAAEVAYLRPADGRPPDLTVTAIALTGASGVLPRMYSEAQAATLHDGSHALHEFLDLLAQRLIGAFATAGIKYRLHRSAETAGLGATPDRVGAALLALTGYGTPHMVPRLAAGSEPLLHYAGTFAMRPRSAERLVAMVADWLGRPVEVRQFAGAWLPLPPDQRTAMPRGRTPGAWNSLGVDAAIGVRAWDAQARVVLRIGPLDRAAFEALLPDRPGLRRLVSLVRAFLGFETGFAINPVLRADAVPPVRLDAAADPPPRLGWNTWLPAARRGPAADASFEAEVVEALA